MLYARPMLTADAVRHFGTKTAIAHALGVRKSTITEWGSLVPRGRAFELVALTKGVLRVNPKLYPKSPARRSKRI